MRLSCNFVNVYKIAYRVLYADILARILARKIVRVGQVGEDLVRVRLVENEVIPVHGKLNMEIAGHADSLVTILAQKSARKYVSVSVSLSAPWNASLTVQVARREIGNAGRASVGNTRRDANASSATKVNEQTHTILPLFRG